MFIGHKKNWDLLVKESQQKRLPSAYLFYGLEGIGKKQVAFHFAKYLFCESGFSDDTPSLFGAVSKIEPPCGKCSACLQLDKNQHPDFFFISSEESSVSVEAVRALQVQLSRVAFSAPVKLAVIDGAHDMTPSAANSLLKTLEEPPPQTLFILMTPSLFQILPTIRSRCRRLFFTPPPMEESARFLEKNFEMSSQQSHELLALTEGSIGLSRQLTEDGFEKILSEWDVFFQKKEKDFYHISRQAQAWADSDINLVSFLEIVKKKFFKNLCTNPQLTSLDQLEKIDRAQKDIDRNVNKTLVLENLLLNLS